jgi:hypothetical protein
MRSVVQEHNIYGWAGDLIAELSSVRIVPKKSETRIGLKGFTVRSIR